MEIWGQCVRALLQREAPASCAAAVRADLACKSFGAVTNAFLGRLLFFQVGRKPNVKSTRDSWPCGKLAPSALALRWEHFITIFTCPARCPP